MSDSQEAPESPPERGNSQQQDAKLLRKMVIKAERRARLGERLQKVMDLRIAGATPLQIGKQLGLSHSHVMRLIKISLKRLAWEYHDVIAMRVLESQRMNAIRLAHWNKKDDPASAAVVIRAAEREASMWGYDSAEQMRILPPEPPMTDIDVNKLSASEAEFLRNILLRQQAERNAIDSTAEPVQRSLPGKVG